MIGETHRRIAQQIAKELHLSNREAGLLETGSINPDSWANFPHHHGKEFEIIKNILEARQLFLQGDDECYHRLGIALHYIEDRWTLRPRLGDKHTECEMQINKAPILNDSQLTEAIKKILLPTKAEEAYLAFLIKIGNGIMNIEEMEGLSERILIRPVHEWTYYSPIKYILSYFQGLGLKTVTFALQGHPTSWSSPVLDINFSYRVCLEVTRKVLSKEHDEGDWYDFDAEKHDTEKRAKDTEMRRNVAITSIWLFILLLGVIFIIMGVVSTNILLLICGLISSMITIVFLIYTWVSILGSKSREL